MMINRKISTETIENNFGVSQKVPVEGKDMKERKLENQPQIPKSNQHFSVLNTLT